VSLTATRDLIVPAIEKPYIIQNNTTGAQSIRVIVAGTGVTVPNGKTAIVYNDGTDVKYAFDHVGALDVGGNATLTTFTATGDGTFSGTGQVKMPAGTTAQRSGSPAAGMFRFNDDTDQFEGYDGTAWGGISGAQAGGAILTNKSTATASYTIARLVRMVCRSAPSRWTLRVTITVSFRPTLACSLGVRDDCNYFR
jgi:hypothetical protein